MACACTVIAPLEELTDHGESLGGSGGVGASGGTGGSGTAGEAGERGLGGASGSDAQGGTGGSVGGSDAGASGGTGGAGGSTGGTSGSLFEGAISTIDRRSRRTGNIEISHDGFEFEPMRCTNGVCVTGGITP